MTNNLTTTNPLASFMRHPEVYVKLPSNGNYYSIDEIEFTADNEIAISSMTSNDDLLLKSPEGLLNGDSITRVIQSCCPGIKNPQNLLVPDFDTLLLGIRQATYGENMKFDISCPKCEYNGSLEISISELLLNIKYLEPEYFVTLSNNAKVYVKPFTVKSSIKEALKKYKEAQTMKLLVEEDLTEDLEKASEFSKSIESLAKLMVELYTDSIVKIIDPNDNELEVSYEHKLEMMNFLTKKDAELIQKKINEITLLGVPKEKTVICPECKNEWNITLNFDPSVFFEISS